MDKYVVLYIDVLGYKKRYKEENFLNEIKDFIKDFKSSFEYDYTFMNGYKVQSLAFSDNMIFFCKYDETKDESLTNALVGLSMIASFNYLNYSQSIILRGAITSGAFYFDDKLNFVYGDALINAYNLENKIAIYPRIIFDPKLIESFNSEVLYKCDDDGIYFIDYLKCIALDTPRPTEWLLNHKNKIIIGLSNTDLAVKQKFLWLKNYYNNFCSDNNFKEHII